VERKYPGFKERTYSPDQKSGPNIADDYFFGALTNTLSNIRAKLMNDDWSKLINLISTAKTRCQAIAIYER